MSLVLQLRKQTVQTNRVCWLCWSYVGYLHHYSPLILHGSIVRLRIRHLEYAITIFLGVLVPLPNTDRLPQVKDFVRGCT